ncbi:hypothetical protein [Leptothrix discophora]|uniref:hypothetical protein n=1 Tax=Leptothrix discophora TaxID=89 RepID=UPI002737BD94|nr:hypothetical protein [Leptothrix discophora]
MALSGCGGGGNGGDTAPASPPAPSTDPPAARTLARSAATAHWPGDVPAGQRRALVVVMTDPALDASPEPALATSLLVAGHVTLTLVGAGRPEAEVADAVDQLCAMPDVPVACETTALLGSGRAAGSIEALARRWAPGAGARIQVRALLTVDAGYVPPGMGMDSAWVRTGLADLTQHGVAMIQSRDDPAAADCGERACGVLPLVVAHGARSQPILSACPAAGPAGVHRPSAGLPDWNAWIVAALQQLLRPWQDRPDAAPGPADLPVNGCLTDLERLRPPGPSLPSIR